MTTYGVTYSSKKNPTGYGVAGTRGLASLLGTQSMQPLSAIKPNGAGFQAINAVAPSDALARVLQNGQNVFASIAPPSTGPAPPPPAKPPAPPSSTYQGVDLSTDPVLQQIKAIGERGIQDANSAALAGAESGLIGYGSVAVPKTLADLYAGDPTNPIYGALNDANTASAAAANPDSTLAQLLRAHNANDVGIDNAENAANLYYSSDHANRLGDEADQYRGSQAQAAQNLAQLLAQQFGGVLSAEQKASDQYVTELPNAYARALAAGTGDPNNPPPPPDGGNSTLAPPDANATVYFDPTSGRYSTTPPRQGTSMVAY